MTKAVLLIDRNTAARGMLRFALELQGCRVVEADDRAGIPAALAGGNPDLLVVGVGPSDAGGGDLIREIRRLPGLDGLPVLLVGEERYEARWDLHLIGNCAWLNKPFRVGELPGLIEGLLGSVALPGSRTTQRLPHADRGL